MKTQRSIYEKLADIRLLRKSYSLKFLFIAFLGIHIPLIGIIFFLLFGPNHLKPLPVFLLILGLTLGATAITLYLLNGLLDPLHRSKSALEDYLEKKILPSLPGHHPDEAGVLMNKLQVSLTVLNNMIEEKEDLASLLSHDLKQPLSVISTSAEAIRDTTDPVLISRFSNNISRMVKEQLNLLEEVLQLLRYNSLFSDQADFGMVPLGEYIEEILEVVNMQAAAKDISIELSSDYDGLVEIHADLFRQVLKNLLHNAVKFSYPGSQIKIDIQQSNGCLVFSIVDQGIGFEPNSKDRLFARFTKEGKKGTNNESSTGIGLYICKKIVEMHKGNIDAYSPGKGKGARFIVSIPNNESNRFDEEVLQSEEEVLQSVSF